ncbi:MAG: peptidylprolyl isomerase [Deltaproteobacteria bacterium]|nr:peptidylprolyl isomerase [Deltaproteobacteria bacterium]
MTFVTESGRFGVALDPSLSPRAVARLLDLARGGFYAGQVVHRVRPGAAVQLGDPVGDGSGGAGRDPVPCETGPVPVPAYTVGMALAGRDSGSSQLFVTLAPAPGLAGDYALVGAADREVEDLVEGERILGVEVRD